MYLQSFMCRDSHSRLLYIWSKERSGCRLIFADRGLKVPHSSDPYNSIGWIVWSKTFKLVFIDGQKERKSFRSLKYAFFALLKQSCFAKFKVPEALKTSPRYLYRVTHSISLPLKRKGTFICLPGELKIMLLVLLVFTFKHQSLQYSHGTENFLNVFDGRQMDRSDEAIESYFFLFTWATTARTPVHNTNNNIISSCDVLYKGYKARNCHTIICNWTSCLLQHHDLVITVIITAITTALTWQRYVAYIAYIHLQVLRPIYRCILHSYCVIFFYLFINSENCGPRARQQLWSRR